MARRARAAAAHFTGALATPIEEGAYRPLEWIQKLDLLFDHYHLERPKDGGSYTLLTLHLARDFVPGFKDAAEEHQRGSGRPKTDTSERLKLLALGVKILKVTGAAKDDLDACRLFAEVENPKLASRSRSTQREQRARTLQNKLPKARALIGSLTKKTY
jgi:hypothetical protein